MLPSISLHKSTTVTNECGGFVQNKTTKQELQIRNDETKNFQYTFYFWGSYA